jgi:colanic acid/amylovoran biosynthesis glycosyltransferase
MTMPNPASVPYFAGRAAADTVVFLLPHYPACYAPALSTEMRLLRDRGIDVQVLALERAQDAGVSDGALTRVVRRLTLSAAAHLRIATRSRAAYCRGLGAAWRNARSEQRRGNAHLRWMWYFCRAIAIGDRLRRGGVTRCHAHFTTNIAVLIAEVFAIEVSLTLHGPTDFAGVSPEMLGAKVAATSFTRTVSLEGMRCVLNACAAQHRRRVVYVPLGVDLSRFTSTSHVRTERNVRIVCVARLEAVKGHAVLIDAFAHLVASGREIELILVGEGRLRRAIGRRVQQLGLHSRVLCTGVIDNADLPALLQSAEIFVLASHAEGLPVALMEAMAVGIPCVATTVNGVPELIVHEQTGLLVPPGDIGALVGALTTLLDAPLLRASLGQAGLLAVTANFDAAVSAGRLAARLEHGPVEWQVPTLSGATATRHRIANGSMPSNAVRERGVHASSGGSRQLQVPVLLPQSPLP